MARCGCSGACACVLSTDGSLSLSGNGSAASPWLLKVVPDCAATMACIDANVDAPLDVNAGHLKLKLSTDAGQVVTTGTDGGLYVPAAAAGAVTIADTSTIDMSGTGQAGTPLKADWLGATVTNAPASGVDLTGVGTAASPLHANWAGVSFNASTPEISHTGAGTPTSPLTLGWTGVPWTRFTATGLTIANGVSGQNIAGFALTSGAGTSGMALGGGDNHTFTTSRAGYYLMVVRMRFALTPGSTVNGGYFQLTFTRNGTGAGLVWDAVSNNYGASWANINLSELVQLADVATNNYSFSLLNSTGSAATGGFCYVNFFRVSD